MPNTADITAASSNILLIGDSGTHKTKFLGDCPSPFIFDFDRGVSILRGKSIEYATFKERPKGLKVTPARTAATGLYEYGNAWPAFVRKMDELGAAMDKGDSQIATIGLDSLTFMSDIAMSHVLVTAGHETPNQGSWGAQQKYLMTVLDDLTTWPVRLVACAHIQRDKNDLTGVTEMLPMLTGKLAGKISAYFDEVYFCDSKVLAPVGTAAAVQSFFLKTRSTPTMRQVKSRYGVPDDVETSFAAVEKYYKLPPKP